MKIIISILILHVMIFHLKGQNSTRQLGVENVVQESQVTINTLSLTAPNISYTDRIGMISVPPGSIIWCTDCGYSGQLQVYDGNLWTDMVGNPALGIPRFELHLGQVYQGGIVAYILPPGSFGYDPDIDKGLIIAPVDQSAGAEWGLFRIKYTWDKPI